MRPLVAEHLDGLRLVHLVVEEDHEPLIPPKALAQDRFGEPGSPNDDGKGWRAFPPKARQNRLKFLPARAVHETAAVGGRDPRAHIAGRRKGPAMAAENRHGTGSRRLETMPASVAPMRGRALSLERWTHPNH